MTSIWAFSPLLRLLRRLWRGRPLVEIDRDLWAEMIAELGRRGLDGRREAGAFLLGYRLGDARKVDRVVYFDDLDPDCLVGHIHLRPPAYSALWDLCELTGLEVVGDVHTHPSTWVGQSSIDRCNPMVASAGHIAVIVPCYSTRLVMARETGVHEYLGEAGWRSHFGPAAGRALSIGGQ